MAEGQTRSFNERFISILQEDQHRAIESLTTLGRANATERVGGLLNKLALTMTGQAVIEPGAAFRTPLTQPHIAQATGLTAIHVNRILRRLREARIVGFRNGVLSIIDPKELQALADHGVNALPERWADTRRDLFGVPTLAPRLAATSTTQKMS